MKLVVGWRGRGEGRTIGRSVYMGTMIWSHYEYHMRRRGCEAGSDGVKAIGYVWVTMLTVKAPASCPPVDRKPRMQALLSCSQQPELRQTQGPHTTPAANVPITADDDVASESQRRGARVIYAPSPAMSRSDWRPMQTKTVSSITSTEQSLPRHSRLLTFGNLQQPDACGSSAGNHGPRTSIHLRFQPAPQPDYHSPGSRLSHVPTILTSV